MMNGQLKILILKTYSKKPKVPEIMVSGTLGVPVRIRISIIPGRFIFDAFRYYLFMTLHLCCVLHNCHTIPLPQVNPIAIVRFSGAIHSRGGGTAAERIVIFVIFSVIFCIYCRRAIPRKELNNRNGCVIIYFVSLYLCADND